jgi:protein TonB
LPRAQFRGLRQQLLNAGITPRFVTRIERELCDHFEDLEREATERGHNALVARDEACRRIGRNCDIVAAFLTRPELQSWFHRSRVVYWSLRLVVIAWLRLRAARRVLLNSAIARYGCATLAAGIVTVTILFGLQLAIKLGGVPISADYPDGSGGQPVVIAVSVSTRNGPTAIEEVGELEEETSDSMPRRSITWPGDWEPQVESDATPFVADVAKPLLELPMPTPHELDLGIADSDFLPLVKISPIYPPSAAARGLEGYVIVEYTVSRSGVVSDIAVIESSSSLFEKSALEAASKFKYLPRIVDGRAVSVSGVRTIIRFRIEA